MNSVIIFYPIFVLVALTFSVGFLMLRSRFAAVKNKQMSIKYFRLNEGNAPEHIQKLSHNYDNLLSMPILFYLAMVIIYIVQAVDETYLLLAWLYVAVRFVHSYIHIGYNNVVHRMYAFVLSSLVLIVIWLRLCFHLMTGVVSS